MSQRTYAKGFCPYGCGTRITTNGYGRTAHYRKHCRDGFLTEHNYSRQLGGYRFFKRTSKPWPQNGRLITEEQEEDDSTRSV